MRKFFEFFSPTDIYNRKVWGTPLLPKNAIVHIKYDLKIKNNNQFASEKNSTYKETN